MFVLMLCLVVLAEILLRLLSSFFQNLMRLHQLASASTGPGYGLLCFPWKENIFNWPKQPSFYPGKVLPSNDVFTSDGAPLATYHRLG